MKLSSREKIGKLLRRKLALQFLRDLEEMTGWDYDLIASLAARDRGLAEVYREKFMAMATGAFERRFAPGWTGTGEDIRRRLLSWGIIPHHHNAWGALVMALLRSGQLLPLGEMTNMKAVRSHGRKTFVYRKA